MLLSSRHIDTPIKDTVFIDCSFGYYLIEVGGQAASEGQFGICSVPIDSYLAVWWSVNEMLALETLDRRPNGGSFPTMSASSSFRRRYSPCNHYNSEIRYSI